MVGIKIKEKKFIPSRDAAKVAGYDADYIGQLCRGGKLECKRVGRVWFVEHSSLVEHCKEKGNGKPFGNTSDGPIDFTDTETGGEARTKILMGIAEAKFSKASLTSQASKALIQGKSEKVETPAVTKIKSPYIARVGKLKNTLAGKSVIVRHAIHQVSHHGAKLLSAKNFTVPSREFLIS